MSGLGWLTRLLAYRMAEENPSKHYRKEGRGEIAFYLTYSRHCIGKYYANI